MGSSSSQMVSSKSSSSSPKNLSGSGGSKLNRAKLKFSSLFCGGFTPKSTYELEDFPEKPSVSCIENSAQTDDSRNSIAESSSLFTSEQGDTHSILETGESSGVNSSIIEEAPPESNLLDPAQESVSGNTPRAHGPTISLADAYDLEYHRDSVNNSDQDLTSGVHQLHLDVVSISSNLLSSEISSRESRRNTRRLFWDALSRRSFRRPSESPTIVFATTGVAAADDELGSSHDRWILDLNGDLHYNGAGHDLDSLGGAGRHRRSERRWLLRSEISERVIGGLNEGGRQTALCVSGLHPDGTCSCDSFFTAEEFRSLASISRIITLAEALFEVLDEIHNQSLSLSLPILTLPAPESLVDTFPLKYHKKIKKAENGSSDAQQCYICLADYEEGDKLRVLPCNHEYHVPCIDKWLKEVNRVCPVCRQNVCEGPGECSISNT